MVSRKKYYVPFNIKVWQRGEAAPLLDHTLDLKGKPVLIKFPLGTLGDMIGWFPYADKFLQKHQCKLECALGAEMIELYRKQYPSIILSEPQKLRTQNPYASYRVGLFLGDNTDKQPVDFRMRGLYRTAGHILGVDPAEVRPRLDLEIPRLIPEPYVCIAVQSSCQAKSGNNGHGWQIVIDDLKARGYRVLCIDKAVTVGKGFVLNQLPHGAEDFTGDRPLSERIALLRHADFFIGLGCGLSGLAWACQIPVIMISGLSLPGCEFYTPYRVYSSHGCLGCWDEIDIAFDHHDFIWCPRYKGAERQYECTWPITGKQVISHIDRLMADHRLSPSP